jgi:hypothetical protein
MAEYESLVQVNLGPLASIESMTAMFSDVATLLQLAKDVQTAINENEAGYLAVRDVQPYRDGQGIENVYLWSMLDLMRLEPAGVSYVPLERERSRQLRRLTSRAEISVISMSYDNPFNIKISFDGGGIAGVLATIRDWSTNRQLARARVRVAEAAATEYEDTVRTRAILRENLLNKLLDDGQTVTRENIAELLPDSTVDALVTLSDAGAEIGLGMSQDD